MTLAPLTTWSTSTTSAPQHYHTFINPNCNDIIERDSPNFSLLQWISSLWVLNLKEELSIIGTLSQPLMGWRHYCYWNQVILIVSYKSFHMNHWIWFRKLLVLFKFLCKKPCPFSVEESPVLPSWFLGNLVAVFNYNDWILGSFHISD